MRQSIHRLLGSTVKKAEGLAGGLSLRANGICRFVMIVRRRSSGMPFRYFPGPSCVEMTAGMVLARCSSTKVIGVALWLPWWPTFKKVALAARASASGLSRIVVHAPTSASPGSGETPTWRRFLSSFLPVKVKGRTNTLCIRTPVRFRPGRARLSNESATSWAVRRAGQRVWRL